MGTVNPNVPTPNSLSSHIRPPISPTMRRHNVSPRPVPSCASTARPLLERLEDTLAVLRCNTDARVGDGDHQVVFLDLRRNDDLAAVRREFHCVAEQIEHHLLEPQLIGLYVADREVDIEDQGEAMIRGARGSSRARTRAPRVLRT